MNRFLLVVSAAVGLAAGLVGCQNPAGGGRTGSSAIPAPEPGAAAAAGLSAQNVTEGRELYITKCVRCHKSYDPAQYTEGAWNEWMAKMGKKARLAPPQNELLTRYLNACRVVAPAAQ
jgi:hypothetical protein